MISRSSRKKKQGIICTVYFVRRIWRLCLTKMENRSQNLSQGSFTIALKSGAILAENDHLPVKMLTSANLLGKFSTNDQIFRKKYFSLLLYQI